MARRFFRHRELHVVLLALLAERSMHGYELMGELAERFGPTYRPSAGSVYPALESLTMENLIRPEKGSEPITYALTPVGKTALARHSSHLNKLEQRTGVALGSKASVEAALADLAQAARVAAQDVNRGRVEGVLAEATKRLHDLNKENS